MYAYPQCGRKAEESKIICQSFIELLRSDENTREFALLLLRQPLCVRISQCRGGGTLASLAVDPMNR